jgi:mono/diheme cytochrome c family protein
MAVQPAYRPLEPAEFFPDGQSARPLLPGTVARGRLRDDDLFYFGTKPGERPGTRPGVEWGSWFADTFPFELSAADVERGRERFGIFCSMCHGATGHGYGKIIERGFTRPPSYHVERDADGKVNKELSLARGYRHRGIEKLLRDAPVGYYFDVATNGYGAMGSYKEQVSPADRWRVVAYIRTLQYAEAAPAERDRLLRGGRP